MPLKWITYKRKQYTLEESLESATILNRYPRSYIQAVFSQRPWKGKPSVTQLLNGTRQSYLEITSDYNAKPEDRAWAVLGTETHQRLENAANEIELSTEERLSYNDISGQRDLVEPYDGYSRIVDYKVIGSYKWAMLQHEEKKEEAWHDYKLQLNMYRILVQKNLEESGIQLHPTKPCWLFGILRDGRTQSARNLKIYDTTFLTPVEVLRDSSVLKYFKHKKRALLKALKTKETPKLCNSQETWEGRKCKSYCDVSKMCKKLEKTSDLNNITLA